MTAFEEGYDFYTTNVSAGVATLKGDGYVQTVQTEIDNFTNEMNSAMQGYKTAVDKLKGNAAEYWHEGTFNIDAALNGSDNRATVLKSNEHASVDVELDSGEKVGLKYYKSGLDSAKQQAKSVFEKYKEYTSKGGSESLDEYLNKRGYSSEDVLNDPIYSGQMRVIPSDQMDEAVKYLERKIIEEQVKRPEQVERYRETLNLLRDRIKDNEGNESIPLSEEDAKKLAELAKKGEFDPAEFDLTTEELMNFEYILKQSFKAGLSAATIALALKVTPEILKAIEYLIENGEIDEAQLKDIGSAALSGAAEGFIKGSISAALTVCCKSGLFGEALKKLNPTIIGAVTVLAYDTIINAYKVVTGEMTRREMTDALIKEMFISACALGIGFIMQVKLPMPQVGFIIGSLIGSIVGSFVYKKAYAPVMSFCVSTGFTMFGLVEQNYTLPDDVIEEIGLEVFDYEQFEYKHFEPEQFTYDEFELKRFEPETIEMTFLRRGVIGVRKIGFVQH